MKKRDLPVLRQAGKEKYQNLKLKAEKRRHCLHNYSFFAGQKKKRKGYQTYDNKTAFHADILMNLNYLWNNLWTNIGIFFYLSVNFGHNGTNNSYSGINW